MLRSISSALALCAVLVACTGSPAATTAPTSTTGGSVATQAPTTPAPATQAPATDAPPATDEPSTTDRPEVSLVPDLPLEELFPDEVGGLDLTVQSASGESVRSLFPSDDDTEIDDLVSRLGTTLDNLSAAYTFSFGPGATEDEFVGISIFAMRVRNVPAQNLIQTFVELTQEESPGSDVGTATISGKTVTSLTDPEAPEDVAYFYPVGDVMFFLGGTAALVEEAFAELP